MFSFNDKIVLHERHEIKQVFKNKLASSIFSRRIIWILSRQRCLTYNSIEICFNMCMCCAWLKTSKPNIIQQTAFILIVIVPIYAMHSTYSLWLQIFYFHKSLSKREFLTFIKEFLLIFLTWNGILLSYFLVFNRNTNKHTCYKIMTK